MTDVAEGAAPRWPTCSLTVRGTRRCPNVAAYRVIVGCLHEHMMRGFVCDDHIGLVRSGRFVACNLCAHGPQPHRCPTLGREATREEQERLGECL